MNQAALHKSSAVGLTFPVLLAASVCHFLNDLMQSVFTATYPLFKSGFDLTFGQIGLLTFTYQMSASIFQPLIGHYTDGKPQPYSLPFASAFSMAGILTLSMAHTYGLLLLGGALLGIGSSIFHPEASRVARLAAGTSHGLAQSIFQVGGNLGSSVGPLLVAFIVLPRGLNSLSWFALAALTGMSILIGISRWYKRNGHAKRGVKPAVQEGALSSRRVGAAIFILTLLMLSKTFYLASFDSFYQFYLMHHFSVSPKDAQLCMFTFLAAVAAGTLVGGPVGDRIGRKKVIWGSILGILPFTLALPYASLWGTIALSMVIGFVLASAFSAIVVFAQSLVPGRIGMISGVFFGLLFGFGGLGAALLGSLADWTSIEFVYKVCSFFPLMGLLTVFLPNTDRGSRAASRAHGKQ
ncbi:MFS transporter [Labrys okinawensis]|uniref:MFS transporter n=1 Tax=Labrys okinawensis TaxID=346911 RepID=UPI0039BD346C